MNVTHVCKKQGVFFQKLSPPRSKYGKKDKRKPTTTTIRRNGCRVCKLRKVLKEGQPEVQKIWVELGDVWIMVCHGFSPKTRRATKRTASLGHFLLSFWLPQQIHRLCELAAILGIPPFTKQYFMVHGISWDGMAYGSHNLSFVNSTEHPKKTPPNDR